MVELFRAVSFKDLLSNNEFQLKTVFGDIFRALLLGLSGPPPPFLVNLILEYIEICFVLAKKEETDCLLRITAHFLKNIDNTPQNQAFFERVLLKIVQSAPKLTKIIEDETTEYFLEIIEEFIIVGVTPQMFDYGSYLTELYTSLSNPNTLVPLDICFKLKSSILSIYTTMLLLDLEKNTYNVANFEVGSPVLFAVHSERNFQPQ